MKFIDVQIKRIKPNTTPYKVSDGGGLFLWVTPSGGKSWRWTYRHEGREKLITFGRYPDVPCLLPERHTEARKLLATGQTQWRSAKPKRRLRRIPFQSVTGLWRAHWQDGKSPRHVDYVKRRMEADVLPCLGARPIAAIEAPELVAMTQTIAQRGARDIAKRALETTGQIFRFAIAHEYATHNPANGIRPSDILKSNRKVNYARVDARELPELLRAIEVYQGTHVTRFALKLIALTFVRASELIGARWTELDSENARWDHPAERMKMRTPHIVPLSRQTLDVRATLRTLTGESEWLFPGGRNAKRSMSNNTILKALERMGYKGRMTGHGFRGVASTILHEQGYNHEHIELQLAHAPRNTISAAYNHALYLEPRAKMMQGWADYLEQTQRGGKVLPFRGSVA